MSREKTCLPQYSVSHMKKKTNIIKYSFLFFLWTKVYIFNNDQ